MIVFRYIGREFLINVFAIFFILLFVLMVGQFAQLLSRAAVNSFGILDIVFLWAIILPTIVPEALPVSVFIAGFMVISRLYSEQEMSIISCMGISIWKVISYIMAIGIILGLLSVGFTSFIIPVVVRQSISSLQTYQEEFGIDNIPINNFFSVSDELTLYASGKEDNALNKIVIAINNGAINEFTWIVAEKMEQNSIDGELFWILSQGYSISENENNFIHNKFEKLYIKNPNVSSTQIQQTYFISSLGFTELINLQEDNLLAKREIYDRLSRGFQVLIALFLGMSFGILRPREERLKNLLPGIIIYIVFLALNISGSQDIGKEGDTFAFYLNYLIFIIIGIGLYFFNSSISLSDKKNKICHFIKSKLSFSAK